MKKKGIVALLLACSFVFGAGTVTACNIFDSPDSEQEQEGDTTVNVTGVSLNKGVLNLKIGNFETLAATVAPNNATNKGVTWKSGNTDVAEVDGSGKVTAKAKGTAIITVTTADGGKTATCTVNVTENEPAPVRVESVSLSPTSKTLKVGEKFTLTPTFTPANPDNKNVSWSASTDAVSVADGVVTANKVGTAVVTVTTADGGKTAHCTVNVEASTPTTINVTGVSLNKTSATLKTGQTLQLIKTITPSNATNQAVTWKSDNQTVATVDGNGLVTAKAAGSAIITVTTADGSFTKTCTVTVEKVPEPVVDPKISYNYAGNECAAFEWDDSDAANAKVEYKLKSASSYTTLSGNDKAYLVRQKDTTTARVDLVGLQGGAAYDFKITTSGGEILTASDVTVHSYDRSGYAHFGKTDGVGAYKDDGTPKSNAVIVYVNEENKNTVTATVNGKTRTGIVDILQNAGTSTPLIVRIVGTVGAATWNKLEENGGKPLTPDKVVGVNGDSLVDFYNIERSTYNSSTKKYEGGASKDISQATLIKDGFNTLNTSVYTELKGLSSKAKYDASKDEFDSCWNDCSISGVKNVTVEGIGEDARIFQWGMTFKSSSSVEVRNLTFEDYTEDACSFEGGSSENSASIDGFKTKNFWVHHNTFEEGINYWDVCNEQDKHDGDGSTDFKYLSNVTISYNNYNSTHKTGLIGGSNSHHQASISFHHNYYNACKSRLPLARQANMHMYNNYYYKTTSTDISLRANAYAFVENCYFGETTSVNVELQHDSSNGNGAAKVVGCKFDNKKTVLADGVNSSNLYIGNDRLATVTNTNTYSTTFDTNSSVFYFDGTRSVVTQMLTADETKQYVPLLAGVQKRGGDVTLGGIGGANDTHEHTYSESYTSAGAGGHYHMATCEHTTEHTALEPHVYDNAEDTTCNECGYVRTLGGESAPTFTATFASVNGLTETAANIENSIALDDKGVLSLISGTNWKTYTGGYIQCGGTAAETDVITIDLTQFTGSVKLTVVAKTTSNKNTGRYYLIDGYGGAQYCKGYGTTEGISASDQTDTFTLECGNVYTLKAYSGLRFKSFAFVPVN